MNNTLNLLTPGQAEAAFYCAFESGDLAAMMAVWSDDSDIVCIHPHGPRLVGYQAIRDGWQQILAHSARMRFNVSELNTINNGNLAIRFVNENIHVSGVSEPNFCVMATNVYRRTPNGWRIILHHASPTPESLLSATDSEQRKLEEKEDRTIH